VPAGLNNIVGLKPTKGLISTAGVVPAAQSVDCVSIFTTHVALAARVLQAAMGHDPADPYARALTPASEPLAPMFRFGLPARLQFHGDAMAEAAFAGAVRQLQALGGTPVAIDFSPLAEAAGLLYDSALVAERYAAIRTFFDARAADVIEPVRSIIQRGQAYSAADLCEAQTRLRALGQRAAGLWQGIDVLLVPTAPTHYTIADMLADPVALNRNLGEYTNFVNLLDYAAIAVPSSIRPDGLPFGVTLIGRCGSDWQLADLAQRYHLATGLAQGQASEKQSNFSTPRSIIAGLALSLAAVSLIFVVRGKRTAQKTAGAVVALVLLLGGVGMLAADIRVPGQPYRGPAKRPDGDRPKLPDHVKVIVVEEGDVITLVLPK
jgi:allophanate hydrolase